MSIEVQGVVKRFGRFTAVGGVSLAVPESALLAVLGPSGSGKSTLLRVMAGLERPDAGRVLIGGRDATRLPARERGIGFVFQQYAPFTHMTVRDNVAFGLSVRHRPKAETQERVDALLRLVQLQGLGDRYPGQLSGGQRQRMVLARALAPEPQVLLLDEPFGALDARVRAELRGWLRRLHDEVKVSTVFVTHDQEEALEIADVVAVMNQGRLEQVGAPRTIYEQPSTAFVMRFVGAATTLGGRLVRPHEVEVWADPVADTEEALVERVAYLGFAVRLDLLLVDGTPVTAQLDVESADEQGFERGQFVYVRPERGAGTQIAVSV